MARARGYSDWKPRPEAAVVINQVIEVLGAEDEALTARQIFYRLVARYQYAKTEKAYKTLCENLVKARRAQMIPFRSIRDEKTDEHGGDWGYDSPTEFWDNLRESADEYGRRIREGQNETVELWCEARGMGPSLARAARPYGVRVYATGGFPGITVNHSMAARAIRAFNDGGTFVFLHLGDLDPSGDAIFSSMREDVRAFVAGHLGSWEAADAAFTATRIGLTQEQVDEYGFETAPPKRSDGRTPGWEAEGKFDSVQLEAVETDLLREWAADAIREHTDLDLLEEVRERSEEEKVKITEGLEKLFAQFDEEE
jgi:hypothetical protein